MAANTSSSSNSGESRDVGEIITGINVTPMVDVMLVLLVIFMITAPALYQAAIRVELPKAVSGEKVDHVTLRFTLFKNGAIALGNDKVTKDQVVEVVKRAVQEDSTANAVIAAEASLTHGEVIEFIDLLKTNGLNRFAIGVDTPQRSKK